MTTLTKNIVRSFQIVHGATGTTYTSPNIWTYQFPSPYMARDGDQVALKYMALYYSWRNVSAAIGNNTFSYYWNIAGTQTLFTLVLQDGIYAFSDITAALNLFMYNNGHYVLDANATPVYYISFSVNATTYSMSLAATPAPSPLPTGYTNPNSITLGGNGPQLVIPAGFATLSGFVAGTYPSTPQNTLYQINSQAPPQITQQSTINVTCSLASNSGFTLGSNVIYSFNTADVNPGALIKIEPPFRDYLLCASGSTNATVTVSLTDQLGNAVSVYDPTGFTMTLNLFNGSE
jgi:hypothetical protein